MSTDPTGTLVYTRKNRYTPWQINWTDEEDIMKRLTGITILATTLLFWAACDDSDDEPVENPNCTQVCDIMINDCDLASDNGPPGATVDDCVNGCVQMNGGDAGEDMMSQVEGFTCAEWAAYLTAYEDPQPVNCMQVCDTMINDCGLASDSGPPGATVDDCTEGCVEQNGNADISDAMMATVAGNTCADWTAYLSGQGDTDGAYPNCTAVCDIIINDCNLASPDGPPGADLPSCIDGCVEQNADIDIASTEVTTMQSMTCDEIALMFTY